MPKKSNDMAYKSLVRPLIKYSRYVWDTHMPNTVRMLEMVQWRAARFVMVDNRRNSSVIQIMSHLQWPTQCERRAQAKCIMVYIIVHAQVAIQIPCTIHQIVSVLELLWKHPSLERPLAANCRLTKSWRFPRAHDFSEHSVNMYMQWCYSAPKCTIQQ